MIWLTAMAAMWVYFAVNFLPGLRQVPTVRLAHHREHNPRRILVGVLVLLHRYHRQPPVGIVRIIHSPPLGSKVILVRT